MTLLALGPAGALGKLPLHGDFLRFGARGPSFDAFDAFLTANVEWAEGRSRSTWAEQYPRAPLHAFVFRGPEPREPLLAGALAPSSDRAGRRFPWVVAAPARPAPSVASVPELLPLLLEPCWEATSQAVLAACTQPDFETSQLPALADVTSEQFDEAAASYGAWTEGLDAEGLTALLFGTASHLDPTGVFDMVFQSVDPLRGHENPRTPLSLRLPLGRAGGAAACFWLGFVRRAAKWRSTIPTFLWSHDGEDGALLLCLGTAPHSTLHELWSPSGTRDEVFDLTRAVETFAPVSEPASGKRRAALRAARSVAELLRAVEAFEP